MLRVRIDGYPVRRLPLTSTTSQACNAYDRDWNGCPSALLDSADMIKKGTTRKGDQRYQCQVCESIFNDLTDTIFSGHQLSISEMFHIIHKMKEHTTSDTFQELDRTYKTVLDFADERQS